MLARLRVLLALTLVALGSTAGAFALSGYFEPHRRHGEPTTAPVATPEPKPKPQLTVPAKRTRFVAVEPEARASPAPPKAEKALPKKKPATPEKRPAATKPSPQRAAAPWPWGLFSN